jgi:hypothetical protein
MFDEPSAGRVRVEAVDDGRHARFPQQVVLESTA